MKLIWIVLCTVLSASQALAVNSTNNDPEAMRECGNKHRLDFASIPGASGQFLESGCRLRCLLGQNQLSSSVWNMGFACPHNPNGICNQAGECIVNQQQLDLLKAERECSNLHGIRFTGTKSHFLNSACTLVCVQQNNQKVSENAHNEGQSCHIDHSSSATAGVCRAGQCIEMVTTTVPPTTQSPLETTTVKQAKYRFSQVEVQVESGNFYNRELTELVASVCVEDAHSYSTYGQCQLPTCDTHSAPVNSTSGDVQWGKHCTMPGPFTEFDFVTISMFERGKYQGIFYYKLEWFFTSQLVKRQSTDRHISVQSDRFFVEHNFNSPIGRLSLRFDFTLAH